MGLTLTVLGCSGTYAGPGNACSGYLVRSDATTVWLDCGPGTLANLQQHVELVDVDALVISHSHPDHWLELPVVRNALRYALGREGLAVYGTAETRGRAEDLCGGELAPTLVWTDINDGASATIGDVVWSFSRTDHPVETLAARIDHGDRSMGYTADTGAHWRLSTLSPMGRGGVLDAVLCEATLPVDQRDAMQHMTAVQAGEQATEAGVARLLLTHLVPGSDAERRRSEAASTFAGPVDVVTVGTTYSL